MIWQWAFLQHLSPQVPSCGGQVHASSPQSTHSFYVGQMITTQARQGSVLCQCRILVRYGGSLYFCLLDWTLTSNWPQEVSDFGEMGSLGVIGVRYGKIDGPGSLLNHQVNQGPLFFNQISQKGHLCLVYLFLGSWHMGTELGQATDVFE